MFYPAFPPLQSLPLTQGLVFPPLTVSHSLTDIPQDFFQPDAFFLCICNMWVGDYNGLIPCAEKMAKKLRKHYAYNGGSC